MLRKTVTFQVNAHRMTSAELRDLAHECERDARIWFECPRQWPNYQAFLGFQVGKALQSHYLESDQIDEFVALVFEIAGS